MSCFLLSLGSRRDRKYSKVPKAGQEKSWWGEGTYINWREEQQSALMMSRGTYLRSSVSFWGRSELAAAVAGIEFRCGLLSLPSGRYRWKRSYQYRVSERGRVTILLINDFFFSLFFFFFRWPCPSFPFPLCLPEEPDWLMSGSLWYFHIDTSIDDGAPKTEGHYWAAVKRSAPCSRTEGLVLRAPEGEAATCGRQVGGRKRREK